ncbi:MAG TPA: hypothetical protein VFM18_17760 [Methanosarcina sp.]|nr:hypothetical protein [Methanosarcina sp.]
MKVKNLIKKLNEAVLRHNAEDEKKLWFKLLKKSLKGKGTQSVK